MFGLVAHSVFYAIVCMILIIINFIAFLDGATRAVNPCALEAFFINFILIILNGGILYCLTQYDTFLKEKLLGCYNAIKCWGNNPGRNNASAPPPPTTAGEQNV